MFEFATTTLAAVGLGATTLAVLVVSEWGDTPERAPEPANHAPIAPALIAIVPPAPVRPLVELASVHVQPANNDTLDSQKDKCKQDQVNRPIVDGDYRPACGNAMTKGGHSRGRR